MLKTEVHDPELGSQLDKLKFAVMPAVAVLVSVTGDAAVPATVATVIVAPAGLEP